jgi:glutamate decarboxylase
MIIKHSSIKQVSTPEHDQIVSSSMNVEKLFATAAVSGSMDEKQLNQQISLMINAFMQQQGVAKKISLPSIIERFTDCNILDSPICAADYFTYLSDNVIPYANQISSPRCLGHMNQVLPYFVHPLMRLLIAMNQNMTKMEASRVFTACERQALAKMHRLIYVCAADFYERHVQNNSSTLGIVTSGGTTANLTAMWCARNVALGAKDDFAGVEKEGLMVALQYNGYQGAVIIGSELMHYSFTKAATIMGLGEKC